MTVSFDGALAVADAVLFEGYVLYPYRASAQKNQLRWQFGVLAPRASPGGETWFSQTECLLEPRDGADLRVAARFLQAQARTVEEATGPGYLPVASLEVDGFPMTAWDEGVERTIEARVPVAELETEHEIAFTVPGGEDLELVPGGRIRRRREPLAGVLRIAAQRLDGPYDVLRLRVRVENQTEWGELDAPRQDRLRRSLIAAHALLGVTAGSFLSLLEPPEWAAPAAAGCENLYTWPVLVGDANDVLLSSPIILYDQPGIAPESPGELYDGTEIDEILTLRTMALTEEEKREARGTDARAAAVIDRVDDLPAEVLERLHGAVRSLRPAPGRSITDVPDVPWWDPGGDPSVSPETDTVPINGVAVGKGTRVRLRPGLRRSDAQDMFLADRTAVVAAVLFDVDSGTHLAVTLEDDPAADLQKHVGRYLYFGPDEVEPLEPLEPRP